MHFGNSAARGEIQVHGDDDEIPAFGLMTLAEQSGAFEWLATEDDLYSLDDLKVRY